MMSDYKYLFGPVPSRRLGLSLGIDLTPAKTCSCDCIYCQLGNTPVKTTERKDYVPVTSVIHELGDWLSHNGSADFITLAGSGEPTLHARFGEVVEFARKNSDIPTALLTNGTLFHLPEVREAAACANVVKVTLNSWNQLLFDHINRPHPSLTFDQFTDSLVRFRKEFKGELWLEVFLIWGVNSLPSDVEKIAILAKDFSPDRIQFNTSVRPPAEDFVIALPKRYMEPLKNLFDPPADLIDDCYSCSQSEIDANEITILSMLRRRPCTASQIGMAFDLHPNEVAKYVGKLVVSGEIKPERRQDLIYYAAVSDWR